MDSLAVDLLDAALRAESRARVAVIAIGEAWKALREQRKEPTEEELRLHFHLVHERQRAARMVAELLNKPCTSELNRA
jgi:hypothetical protein